MRYTQIHRIQASGGISMHAKVKLAIAVAAVLTLAAGAGQTPAAAASPASYHVSARYAVGGDGGWDYLSVDPNTHRLYISRGTHVMIVDAGTGKVVGDLPNTPGVHGIAFAPELGRGFTSNGR